MTGILEQIAADVAAIKAHLASQGTGAAAPQAQPQAQPQALAQPISGPVATTPFPPAGGAQLQPQGLGGGAAIGQQVSNVSAEMITALITPHVADPNLKTALQQQMAAMGIGALPDAQPHQYGELYQRFQQVIAKFQAAAGQVQQAAAAPASII